MRGRLPRRKHLRAGVAMMARPSGRRLAWRPSTGSETYCPAAIARMGRYARRAFAISGRDRHARRIVRFFAASPRKTTKYLSHLYFDLRVGAAKNASVFHLRALIDDEESDVRQMEAQRLPPHLAEKPISDPDRKVRTVMARRAPPDIFAHAMRDDDAQVHDEAARSAGAHDYCRAVGAAGPIGVVRRRRRLESPLSLGGAAFGGFARAAARRSRSGSKAPRQASLEEAQQ